MSEDLHAQTETWVGHVAAYWKQRARTAEAALERVRALHQPMRRGGLTICAHCSAWNGSRCRGEMKPHPCPTLTALEGDQ